MKHFLFSLICVISVLAFSSCASYRTSAPIVGYDSYGIRADVQAELDPASLKDVSVTMKKNYIFWIIPMNFSKDKTLLSANHYPIASNPFSLIGDLQGKALYKAKINNSADLILNPEFEIERHSWFLGFLRKNSVT